MTWRSTTPTTRTCGSTLDFQSCGARGEGTGRQTLRPVRREAPRPLCRCVGDCDCAISQLEVRRVAQRWAWQTTLDANAYPTCVGHNHCRVDRLHGTYMVPPGRAPEKQQGGVCEKAAAAAAQQLDSDGKGRGRQSNGGGKRGAGRSPSPSPVAGSKRATTAHRRGGAGAGRRP